MDQNSPQRVESRHLVDLAMRSVGNPEALIETAIAWTAITRPYVSGTRGFARWSGTTDKVVREIAGPTGGRSKFSSLWTTTRGVASPIAEERDSMELRYLDTRTHNRSTPYNPCGLVGLGALALGEKEVLEKIKSNAVLSARIGQRTQEVLVRGMKTLGVLVELNTLTESGQILAMLDPGLDIWAEVDGDTEIRTAASPLGRRAWFLAVMSGLEDVVLSVSDIEELTGLSRRGVQALLARMAKADPVLVEKVRKGRSFEYRIGWASRLRKTGEWWDDCFERDLIRRARAAKDRVVQETSARRGTAAGYLAYRYSMANPRRDEFLAANPLPTDADPTWRALVEAGDEMALYGHLRAEEAAAGPVPASPEVLVQDAPQKPVETPEDAELQARLAEMRARMARSVPDQPVQREAPVREEVSSGDETEDDRKLRSIYGGDARLFASVYGHLPNQSKPADLGRRRKPRRVSTAL
ncbi:hypothetical protein [Streptomyces sp. CO7]